MNDILDLYQYADEQHIDVDWIPMKKAASLSLQFPDGHCAVAIDLFKTETTAKHLTNLGHELGHCETGSFYNRYTPYEIQQRNENRADKWAIKKLVPKDELDKAVAEGRTELWELADYFGVTEDFMRKAVCWYKNGNLHTAYM